MAIAYVNGNSATNDGSASTIAAGAFIASAGNLIVVGVINYSDPARTVSSITDTAGNSYSLAGNVYSPDAYGRFEIWYSENVTGHASNVVTVTFSGAATYRRIIAAQYSGAATSSAHDTGFDVAGNTDSATAYQTSADTTAADGEVLVGLFGDLVTASMTYSSSSPSTLRAQVSGDIALADYVVGAAGSYQVSVAGNRNETVACYAKAFKQAAAGGSSIVPLLMSQYRARRQ